tara:strand:- start:112 stop:396 length:285 start_codon:yes stop_codon:yes gene_type:complete
LLFEEPPLDEEDVCRFWVFPDLFIPFWDPILVSFPIEDRLLLLVLFSSLSAGSGEEFSGTSANRAVGESFELTDEVDEADEADEVEVLSLLSGP